MPGDVIDGDDPDYIMQRIRTLYLNDSTVTIVMIGRCTWARRYADWEVAASLRNTVNSRRNGLMAITLPSVADLSSRQVPPRVDDNIDGQTGYARWWKYPSSAESLANYIEIAYSQRTAFLGSVDNSRPLFGFDRACAAAH